MSFSPADVDNKHSFCGLLRENTQSFRLNGDQRWEDTFIREKKRTFALKSDSIGIFAFSSTFNNILGRSDMRHSAHEREKYIFLNSNRQQI